MQENRLASGDDETGRGCSEYYRPSRVEGVVNEGGKMRRGPLSKRRTNVRVKRGDSLRPLAKLLPFFD